MEKDETKGTDGSSIRPVSSLRSHFETLKAVGQTGDPVSGRTETAKKLLQDESAQSPKAVRVSLDQPRPCPPWNSLGTRNGEKPIAPKGPAASCRRSPSMSGRRRPMSMNLSPTPQPTPAVTVNSPKSPPRTMPGSRSGSRSPKNAKSPLLSNGICVYDKMSQQSPSSPAHQQPVRSSDRVPRSLPEVSGFMIPSTFLPRMSSIPPVVNRAEKPKIPNKPKSLDHEGSRLTTEYVKATEKAASPFTTPPSSEDSRSPERQVSMGSFTPPEVANTTEHMPAEHDMAGGNFEQQGKKVRDPRFQGFSDSTASTVPNDAGSLATSAESVAYKNSRIARANTVSEHRSPHYTTDQAAPDLALLPPRPGRRHASEKTNAILPSNGQNSPPHSSNVSQHNPQSVGSSMLSNTPRKAITPARRAPPPPPPPPTEETTLQYSTRPSVSTPLPAVRSISSINSGRSPIVQSPKISSDFPRPPRRNTFDKIETPCATDRDTNLPKTGVVGNLSRPYAEDSDGSEETEQDVPNSRSEYPDSSQANRRPPQFHQGVRDIPTKFDSRVFDLCGQYACTTGYVTRIWDLSRGEQIMSLSHGETVKMLSITFKPGRNLEEEGSRIWLGSNIGELYEIDVRTHGVVATSTAHNRREILRILRHRKALWTLDDEGKLFVWPGDRSRVPNLRAAYHPHRVPKGHTFSMTVRDELWYATGREVSVFRPGDDTSFSVLRRPLSQSGTGEITCGAYKSRRGGLAYFGHSDGKVTIYSVKTYTCTAIIKVSDYKINSMSFVGEDLWTAYKTGKIYVYETSSKPWKVKKAWRAHDGPIASLLVDLNSIFALDRLHVASLGHDNCIRFWDGMLANDWQEAAMQDNDVKYCTFREIRAAVVTWNVGACNPLDVRSDFVSDAIHVEDPPEILVFGFQEIVDLEDRAITAKSILGFAKKRDKENARSEQYVSRVYRQWRDFLGKAINRYIDARYSYTEIHTSCLIGLFQCIFVRREEKENIRNLSSTDVKCGLKGHYGNKGALVTRFMFDHSSLCFANCHLAAGQTQTSHRNNDIASILEADSLPPERDVDSRTSIYVGGGNGSQVLDHEICVVNGDLNYRLDAIPRDNVVKMINDGELEKLLERDQIMVSRRRVSGFRLRVFNEAPITFAPTYKYDIGSDNYDSSEKKRSPAWCDRLLYRGFGRIKQTEYRRHEIRASDHRPVSGIFKIRVKAIDHDRQMQTRSECQRQFGEMRRRFLDEAG